MNNYRFINEGGEVFCNYYHKCIFFQIGTCVFSDSNLFITRGYVWRNIWIPFTPGGGLILRYKRSEKFCVY